MQKDRSGARRTGQEFTGAHERAVADAAVIADLLDAEQRRRYARSDDQALTAQLITAERRTVLLTAPQRTEEERRSAAEALGADRRLQRWEGHEARAECGVVLVGLPFLVCGGLGLLLKNQVLFVIGALCLVLGGLLLGVRFVWRRRAAARRVRVLLDWASHRTGQFGRGLPLHGGAAATSLWSSRLARRLMTIVAAVGGLLLAIQLSSVLSGTEGAGDPFLRVAGPAAAVAGLVYFLGGPLLHRRAVRRDLALDWLPTTSRPGGPGADEEGADDLDD